MQFRGSPEQLHLIYQTADSIYQTFSIKEGKPVEFIPKMGLCRELSKELGAALREFNFSTTLRETPRGLRYYHVHLDLDDWRVDPSWQQYLPGGQSWKLSGVYLPDMERRNPPKVLVVRTHNLPQVLTYWGFPERVHNIWTEAEIKPITALGK